MSERSLPFDKVMIVGQTNSDSGVSVLIEDSSGNALLIQAATASVPSAKKGYAKGCMCINTTTGALTINTGSTTSCTFATTGTSGYSGATGTSGYSGVSGAHS